MKKNKKQYSHLFRTCILVILLAVFLSAGIFIGFQKYREGILDVCANEQDGYVKLVLDQINLKKNRSDDEIISDILKTLDSSSGRYWSFSQNEKFLFVKDVMETNQYKDVSTDTFYDTKSAQNFIHHLRNNDVRHATIQVNGDDYLASGTYFTYGGQKYSLVLLSSVNVFLDNNSFLGAETSLGALIGIALILLIIIPLVLSWRMDGITLKLADSEAENVTLRQSLKKAGRRWLDSRLTNVHGSLLKKMKYHTYELKFYLNAQHYITIDGKHGQIHPHTWELTLTIELPRDSFVEFTEVEDDIQKYLETYQNQTLNELEPFDVIEPTMENMTDYFAGEFKKILEKMNGNLQEVKNSETPTRSYIVDLNEDVSSKDEDTNE